MLPPQASVLSAFGALVTPVRLDLVRSALSRLDDLDWAAVGALVDDMRAEAGTALAETGTPREQVRWRLGADLRYAGQQNEVSVNFDRDPIASRDGELIRGVFETAYFAQYGVNPSHVPIEVVSWRLTAQAPEDAAKDPHSPAGAEGRPRGERAIPLWPDAGPAKIYQRAGLVRGQAVAGPALIEERETTVVLPPGWTGVVDNIGCITAKRKV
jgi:N-methylhydantoinase A